MAVELENSIFIHVGRTGGYWVRDVLHEAGLYQGDIMHFHAMPHELMAQDLNTKPMFAFLRNPISWLASTWVHHVNFTWNEPDKLLRSDTFDGFLRNIIEYKPDYIRSIYEPVLDHCDTVGKTESLNKDLADFVKKYEGVDISDCVDNIPANNKTSDFLFAGPVLAKSSTLTELYNLNADIFERLDYEVDHKKFSVEESKYSEQNGKGKLDILISEYSGKYKVLSDDTVDEISSDYNLDSTKLKQINNLELKSSVLLPNDILIPAKKVKIQYFVRSILYSIESCIEQRKNILVIGDVDGAISSYVYKFNPEKVTVYNFSKNCNINLINELFHENSISLKLLNLQTLSSETDKYDLIVMNDDVNRTGYLQDLIQVIGEKCNRDAVIITHTLCSDMYRTIPINLTLCGEYNPFTDRIINLPNDKWLNDIFSFNGMEKKEDITYLRMPVRNTKKLEKFSLLDLPNQYKKELQRNSIITRRTTVYEYNNE